MTIEPDRDTHRQVPAEATARVCTPPPLGQSEQWVADAYRAHRDFVFRVLGRLGVDESTVEDAVHDVFLVLHRRRLDFEGRAAVKTWLYGIALRVARARRTKQRRHDDLDVRAPHKVQPAADHVTPEHVASDRQALALVDRILDEMAPERREVLVLADLEGLAGAEIAAVVGAKRNTVYSRLRLARRDFARMAAEITRRTDEDADA